MSFPASAAASSTSTPARSASQAITPTNEVSHRIKNNLQIIVGLIAYEVRTTPKQCVQGYQSMQMRIGAIAALYDLISHASRGGAVALDG